MTVYVMTIVLFLTKGLVVTHTIQAPDMADCEGARGLIEKNMMDQSVTVGDEKYIVLDAQTLPCVAVTQRDHA